MVVFSLALERQHSGTLKGYNTEGRTVGSWKAFVLVQVSQGPETGLGEWKGRGGQEGVRRCIHRTHVHVLEVCEDRGALHICSLWELLNGGTFTQDGKDEQGNVHSVLETLTWKGHSADPDGNKTLTDTASIFQFLVNHFNTPLLSQFNTHLLSLYYM